MSVTKLEVVQADAIVREDLVDVLERALSLARSGELQCVALAGIRSDGYAITNFSLSRSRFEMLGALVSLQNSILADLNAEE